MNDPTIIHETVVKEIIDFIQSTKDTLSDLDFETWAKKRPPMSYSSIAKASSNLTMVFPVLSSRNVPISTASMVSKALEKKFVSMLQMLFASAQIMNSDVNSVQDYINQFHGNISTRIADLDDIFNYVESSALPDAIKEGEVMKDFRMNTCHTLPSDISEKSISEMFVVAEGAANPINQTYIDYRKSSTNANNAKAERDRAAAARDLAAIGIDKAEFESKIKKDNIEMVKNRKEYFKDQILDSDYKKANELQPTTMYINFTVMPKDGGQPVTINDGVVGVKAKLYPIGSDDVISHLVDKEQNKNWVTNFVRATTREISFFKDFLFAVDKAKIDAMSMSERKGSSSKMWKVLERRATNSRIKRAMKQSNNMAAITTLVISQDEVEYMKSTYNIDMEKTSSVINLFNSLNLIGFVIVDDSLEIAKFIFDEQDPTWETISYTHLEREASDNTYKKVVNLMSKMR